MNGLVLMKTSAQRISQAEGTHVVICVNKVLMRIECSKEEVMKFCIGE